MSTGIKTPEQTLQTAQRFAMALQVRSEIFRAVNSLPLAQRAALMLVEIEGLGYAEVAERLDIKRTDVGNLTRRARLARDRNLSPRLRTLDTDRTLGFSEIRADRALRVSMVRWASEMAEGVCSRCATLFRLHPAQAECPGDGFENG